MGIKEIWAQYKEFLRQIRWPFKANIWLGMSAIVAIGGAAIMAILFFVLKILPLGWIHGLVMTIIMFIVLFDGMVAYPYLKAVKRTERIDKALPDALKQMADTLKAGGTFEYALRGISNSEYGPLTDEMNKVLRRLEEGENLENSLRSFSDNITSRIVTRAVNIIIDSISAGAALADILDEIADDVKANQRIIDERKSSTMMQVLFMVAAGVFVSPFIFGLVVSIVTFLMSQSPAMLNMNTGSACMAYCQGDFLQAENCKSQEASISCPKNLCPEDYWTCVTDSVMLYIVLYIIIETVAIGLMIALVREGNVSKSFIYIPALLLLAYLVFLVSNIVTKGFFGG